MESKENFTTRRPVSVQDLSAVTGSEENCSNHFESNFFTVLSGFEKIDSALQLENVQLNQQYEELMAEKLALSEEVAGILDDQRDWELQYNELLRKYNRALVKLQQAEEREEALRHHDKVLEEEVETAQRKLDEIKIKIALKMDSSNSEWEDREKVLEAERSRVKAQLARSSMKAEHLERDLETKTKELEKLSKLCDELIEGKNK